MTKNISNIENHDVVWRTNLCRTRDLILRLWSAKISYHTTFAAINIYLATQQDEWKVFRIRWTCLSQKDSFQLTSSKVTVQNKRSIEYYLTQKLLHPIAKIIECSFRSHQTQGHSCPNHCRRLYTNSDTVLDQQHPISSEFQVRISTYLGCNELFPRTRLAMTVKNLNSLSTRWNRITVSCIQWSTESICDNYAGNNMVDW